MKQVIVVRTDLEMGKGKIAVQVAHATQLLIEDIIDTMERYWMAAPVKPEYEWYKEWKKTLYRKVVLKTDSEAEIFRLFDQAEKAGLPTVIVRDAGLTQIESGTVTCVGIGPCPDEMVDKITSHLKLL